MICCKSNAVLPLDLANEQATRAFGKRIAQASRLGDVITLVGDLGIGKTVFARAFIQASTHADEEVLSPTFTLLQIYEGEKMKIYHFDLFRLQHAEEAVELGIEDALVEGISLIEWPEKIGIFLPNNRLEITFTQGRKPDQRKVSLVGHGYWSAKLREFNSDDTTHV
ncbi:MAG: tRNA (adenosine(37)-N6)-threonylcarbamoyltransferase complex ATPase subunit type 1 TsaE [Rhodospirillaceae bacterium TMED8]|nr:tRNA (adenosine(37)-N6)-threonylcarbamoyltransferase complex ATPase subunit type 1 TsaE [Magnetovibrio sp.]OUT51153.1 MAG: tRNA (adenosine(37)-N6)-threonylcarbamoyltransferase complex ATPase subunit type 1 TsaE [Rhodospirillaceae bacterium TMED8]|tara:strand:+ start:423 stop:923 length:501 start_codon:yes stop_codon:yes gene_type:complete